MASLHTVGRQHQLLNSYKWTGDQARCKSKRHHTSTAPIRIAMQLKTKGQAACRSKPHHTRYASTAFTRRIAMLSNKITRPHARASLTTPGAPARHQPAAARPPSCDPAVRGRAAAACKHSSAMGLCPCMHAQVLAHAAPRPVGACSTGPPAASPLGVCAASVLLHEVVALLYSIPPTLGRTPSVVPTGTTAATPCVVFCAGATGGGRATAP